MTISQAVALLLRAGLGALLVVAGALKLRSPTAFSVEIANYRLLPSVAPHLAAALPAVEIVLGVALLVLPLVWRRAATVATLGVLVTFMIAVASAYFRGLNIDCGCFGTGGSPITGFTIVRNVALIGAGLALLRLDGGPHGPRVKM